MGMFRKKGFRNVEKCEEKEPPKVIAIEKKNKKWRDYKITVECDTDFHRGWVIIPFHIVIDHEVKMYIRQKNIFLPVLKVSLGFLWWSATFVFLKETKDGQNIKE